MTIRSATIEDAQSLLLIYAPYVLETAISFEYEVPSVEEFTKRIQTTLQAYPYLIAEENGKILGYCYAGAFHSRKAYERSAEISIYIDGTSRKNGIGRMLYEEMERLLRDRGIMNLYACIAYTEKEDEYLTGASVAFHTKMGYQQCGHFHRCGYKFEHWYDMMYMEKFL